MEQKTEKTIQTALAAERKNSAANTKQGSLGIQADHKMSKMEVCRDNHTSSPGLACKLHHS